MWSHSLITRILLCHTQIWIIAVPWRNDLSYQICPSIDSKRISSHLHHTQRTVLRQCKLCPQADPGSPAGSIQLHRHKEFSHNQLHDANRDISLSYWTNRHCKPTCFCNAASLPSSALFPHHLSTLQPQHPPVNACLLCGKWKQICWSSRTEPWSCSRVSISGCVVIPHHKYSFTSVQEMSKNIEKSDKENEDYV